MAQWEFVEWLLFWILETSHFVFEWDEGNSTKSAKKHGVETNEIKKERMQYEEILRKITERV